MGGVLGILLGSASQVSVVMSPGDIYASGTVSSSNTFPESIGVSGGVATAYNWAVVSNSGGGWSIQSGQGTANAVFLVTGVGPSGDAIAQIKCDVTVNGTVYTVNATLEYQRL